MSEKISLDSSESNRMTMGKWNDLQEQVKEGRE